MSRPRTPPSGISPALTRTTTRPMLASHSRAASRVRWKVTLSTTVRSRQIWDGHCVSHRTENILAWRAGVDVAESKVNTVNMRYAVDTCAFDFPQANNKTMSYSCQNACVKLSTSLETNIQNPSNSTPYDYCQDETFVPNIDSCASCYAVHPDQVYLSNCEI